MTICQAQSIIAQPAMTNETLLQDSRVILINCQIFVRSHTTITEAWMIILVVEFELIRET